MKRTEIAEFCQQRRREKRGENKNMQNRNPHSRNQLENQINGTRFCCCLDFINKLLATRHQARRLFFFADVRGRFISCVMPCAPTRRAHCVGHTSPFPFPFIHFNLLSRSSHFGNFRATNAEMCEKDTAPHMRFNTTRIWCRGKNSDLDFDVRYAMQTIIYLRKKRKREIFEIRNSNGKSMHSK